MFNFPEFVEKWATAYVPISHDHSIDGGRGDRFFQVDRYEQLQEVAKRLTQLNKADSAVVVITAHDGELVALSERASKPNFFQWRRHVLFWVQEEQANQHRTIPSDEYACTRAKNRAVEMCEDFIAFFDEAGDPNKGNMNLRGWEYDEVVVQTLPVNFNGWWVCSLSMSQYEPRKKCVIDSKYNVDVLNEQFSGLSAYLQQRDKKK